MAKYTLKSTKASYRAAWDNMIIHPHVLPVAQRKADQIISFKDRYLPLEAITGVPWYFIGLVHMRESNNNFNTHLHNGDPLNVKVNGVLTFKRTTHVPYNRPKAPPKNGKTYTFEESAIDALLGEFGTAKIDWSIEQIALLQETFNGFGYRNMGRPSPYLWAGSNQYSRGKYIRDRVYDPTVVDSQLGVMVVLKCVMDKLQGQVEAVPTAAIQETITPVASDEPAPQDGPISPAADTKRPTTKELRKVSTKFNLLAWMRNLLGWGAVGTTGAKALDASNIVATKSYIDTLNAFISDYGIFLFIIAIIAAFTITYIVMEKMKGDVEDDRYLPSGEK